MIGLRASGKWHGDEAKARTRRQAAEGLLRCAVFFATAHMQALNVSNPRPYATPSREGEYPRKRTGWLQAHVTWAPQSVAEVERDQAVRVGYAQNASYGLILELFRGRLGLTETLEAVRPRLAALSGGG